MVCAEIVHTSGVQPLDAFGSLRKYKSCGLGSIPKKSQVGQVIEAPRNIPKSIVPVRRPELDGLVVPVRMLRLLGRKLERFSITRLEG
jgi:hypothetical protein